ncbi:C40 family peptidase [Larsenimonas rhizosphaerae]|uniref:C40 family peptidase n=1 Tax=Larsenimonas rhizosphaerae TaxID=2944682 RepID=A0AA41ZIU5_9GAMM|nr:C40 family peptidase [Larsenimonas rhizosphaerae]MCX2525014.1 C40 family peptidase [Larsenimonas rhizosphaerae]
MRIAVTLANLWASPRAPRPVDRRSTAPAPDMSGWLDDMTDQDRLGLCQDKRLVTQALFNTPVTVLAREGEWARVRVLDQPTGVPARGYPGWLPMAHLATPSREQGTPYRVTREGATLALDNGTLLPLLFLTRLTVRDMTSESAHVETPLGSGTLPTRALMRLDDIADHGPDALLHLARSFMGLRYLWAGNSPLGLDCSGFTHTVFLGRNIKIPRDACDQARGGDAITPGQQRPGDLLFFERPDRKGSLRIDHVGLYLGDDTLLHAPTNNAHIECQQIEGSRYARELAVVRRYTTGNAASGCDAL